MTFFVERFRDFFLRLHDFCRGEVVRFFWRLRDFFGGEVA